MATQFLTARASKSGNAPIRNSLRLTYDLTKVSALIEGSISGSIASHLIFIVVNDIPTPIKSVTFDILKESGLLDALKPELFDSFVIRDWFKRSVCERVVRERAKTKSAQYPI
jgi:hypothetical protein